MSGFLQILQGLGPIRLAAVGTVMLGVLGFFIYLMTQTTGGNMALLYSQLEPAEGAKIVDKLESMGIPVEIKGEGTAIYIPSDKIARARMDLAQEGLPGGGTVGYEIFDRNDLLSTSSSMIDINKLRALEGELAKSIKTISGVASARVHLVLPKREVFSKDKTPPSASIVLKMKGASKLSGTQVQSIQYLVASAVPSLPSDKISIIDDKGNLLAKGTEGEEGVQGLLLKQETKLKYENTLAKSIEKLIEKTVGEGKVRVEISSEMDFDQVTINSEKYDPEGQVIRSTNNAEEDSASQEGAEQTVSVQNALPQNQPAAGGNANGNKSKRNEENVSYEISRTVESHRKEVGSIKNLSVAVLVDGTYKTVEGKSTYTPRTKEELDQIKLLAQTAMGYKSDRGDKIEVINMPFARADLPEEADQNKPNSWFGQMDMTRIIELAVLAAVGILILLMVVRPIILRVLENSETVNKDAEAQALLASANGQDFPSLPDFSGTKQLGDTSSSYSNDNEDEEDTLVSVHNVEGRVKASSLKRISEIIDKHPEEAVTILRSWMYEEPWKQEKTI